MDAEAAWLFLSCAISTVGFAFLVYGRKQARLPQAVVGVLMMGYPYCVSNIWLMAAIAVALVGCLWAAVHMGW